MTVMAVRQRLGPVVHSEACLTADTCLTPDPRVTSLIPAWSHTFLRLIMKCLL